MTTKHLFFAFLFMAFITPACAFQVQSSDKDDAAKPSRYRAPGASGAVQIRPVTTRTMGTYGSRQKWSRSAVTTQGVQTSVAGSQPAPKAALPAGDDGVAESPDLTLPANNTNARRANASAGKMPEARSWAPASNAPSAARAPRAAVPAAKDAPRVPADAAASRKQVQDMARQMGIKLPESDTRSAGGSEDMMGGSSLKQVQDMAKQMGVKLPELDALSAAGVTDMMDGGATDESAPSAPQPAVAQPAAGAKSDKMFGNFDEFKKVK